MSKNKLLTAPAASAEPTGTTDTPAEEKANQGAKISDAVQKIGKRLLQDNPAMQAVYLTADGRGFYTQNDADNHAKTLQEKTVTTVKRTK